MFQVRTQNIHEAHPGFPTPSDDPFSLQKALTTWLRNFSWDSHLSREELAAVVTELLPRRHKRADGTGAPPDPGTFPLGFGVILELLRPWEGFPGRFGVPHPWRCPGNSWTWHSVLVTKWGSGTDQPWRFFQPK